MISLPNLTLFAIDGGRGQELIRLALRDTLEQITPTRTLVFSCDLEFWRFHNFETVSIPKCSSAKEATKIMWYVIPSWISTPFMMHVEWDGWVIDASAWQPEFLDYDYIGAPWPWHPEGSNVGNGLGIRSLRLMEHLRLTHGVPEFKFPDREDDWICREARPKLEKSGFKFAPAALARAFSWERGPQPGPTFMFHGVFNWKSVLTPDQLIERLALITDYERSKVEWRELEEQL